MFMQFLQKALAVVVTNTMQIANNHFNLSLALSGSPKKHRSRRNYSTNITASLALPEFREACKSKEKNVKEPILSKLISLEKERKQLTEPAQIDALLAKEVTLLDEKIKEHAARRVDLFFYLVLAVYEKQVIISKDKTIKQHGKGSKIRGSQACHSSLFPNVQLTTIPSKWQFFKKISAPTLAGTQLDEALNMTVELPNAVNAFDGHLEGRYRPTVYVQSLLNVLNEAASGKKNPQACMDNFFCIMNEFFLDMEKKCFTKKTIDTPITTKKIWEYEQAGTFQAANADKKTVNEDYMHLMLRLTQVEIASLKKKPELISGFYKRIQNEIYNARLDNKSSYHSRFI